MALIGEIVFGETPLTEQDLQALKLPLIRTRAQLSAVEGPNIVGGKQWALSSTRSRMPHMLSIDYMQELHRRMLGDVWEWAGEVRSVELQNAFASPAHDIRPQLTLLYADVTEHWLKDSSMSPDELAVRVHHRLVKVHPFRNGNGRHSRLLADTLLAKHFGLEPFSWGGSGEFGDADPYRQTYLDSLRSADKGDYSLLMRLCRARKDTDP